MLLSLSLIVNADPTLTLIGAQVTRKPIVSLAAPLLTTCLSRSGPRADSIRSQFGRRDRTDHAQNGARQETGSERGALGHDRSSHLFLIGVDRTAACGRNSSMRATASLLGSS
jgi:hypothetical protein